MATIQCDIVSAEEEIYSGDIDMLVATGSQGEIGVTPGHAALFCDLKPGPVRVLKDGEEKIFYVSSGFLEVQPKIVIILADTAARADDLDEAAAIEAQKAAEAAIANQAADLDYSLAAAELAAAAAQLRTIQQIRKTLGK